MRLFIALSIDERAAIALSSLAAELASGDGRPVPARNMHVTLRFLGEVSAGLAGEVSSAVMGLGELPMPIVSAAGLDVFRAGGGATVYARLSGDTGGIAKIYGAVSAGLAALGVPPEKRAFRPHVTLLRGARGGFLPAFTTPPFPCPSVCVFRSELGGGPPTYKKLAELKLQPREPT